MTMTVIQHQEVGAGGAASITFSDIPQTYTDLYLVLSGRSTSYATSPEPHVNVGVKINGTTVGYSERMLYARATSVSSASTSGSAFVWSLIINSSLTTANVVGNSSFYIPNYTNSNYKSCSADNTSENNGTEHFMATWAGLWSNNAAITSLELIPQAGNFAQYSSATLIGIKSGSDGITSVS